jgi:hypothetical protein
MIDTVLLCIAWAVIGYALALIENEWEIAKYERDSHDDLSNARKELHTSKQFYQRRFDLLQKAQRLMREPERTLVCDILANGALLPDPRGLRYGRLDPQWPLATEASPPQPSANAISLKHRPDRFACFHCRQFRHNGRFMICWCDWDRHEFPALCDEYAPKHGH